MDINQNPYYQQALDYIKEHDLSAMETGKHVIDGEHLFVNIVESSLKAIEDARLEVHDRYIDVQVPLSGPETFGVKPRVMCTEPDGEMNTDKDILFFNDRSMATITVEAGKPVTFAPETAHAPLIGEGTIRKAIFKVEVV